MLKAKQYDWKDSNLALFGSDTEKKVKKQSAETEPAWEVSRPDEIGLVIWRIVKFKVENLNPEDYGQFYNGDSYIILNKYKNEDSDEILMDVHFWIGKYSTQDEYGTAAYKTVELDTFLDDKPVQHREVQAHESSLFKSYFENMTILKGGADTGFRRVLPECPPKRLFLVKGKTMKNTTVTEISKKKGNINDEDCFILDLGNEIIVYSGPSCDKDEKFKATQYVNQLKSDRAGKSKLTIADRADMITKHLADGQSKSKNGMEPLEKLFILSDEGGNSTFKELVDGIGAVTKALFNSQDVFVYETEKMVLVWVGKEASVDERRNSMGYAHNLISKSEDPFRPITVMSEGATNGIFDQLPE
ncbi:gelsolin-like protein 1 [Tubulanus polymorphus]|uniref:gelsolin-like protein 1 n=1 Tax=Tubulanus polymorphus TaxID=672921 RepID=UPI003DA30BDB